MCHVARAVGREILLKLIGVWDLLTHQRFYTGWGHTNTSTRCVIHAIDASAASLCFAWDIHVFFSTEQFVKNISFQPFLSSDNLVNDNPVFDVMTTDMAHNMTNTIRIVKQSTRRLLLWMRFPCMKKVALVSIMCLKAQVKREPCQEEDVTCCKLHPISIATSSWPQSWE